MKRIIPFVYLIVITGILGAILYPIFARPKIHNHRPSAISKLKQLGTAHLIYATDYDERFPHSTTRPTVISQLNPYVRNDSIWDSAKDVSLPINFNFNISGTLSSSKPIGHPYAESAQITLIYALSDPQSKKQGVYQASQDGSVQFIPLGELLDSLAFQFERAGVTLASADYIAPSYEELQQATKDQVK